MNLAREHLQDAESLQQQNRPRGCYSRAYYAAYNASKAIRFLVTGRVSLHGDDHKRAAELPNDFPDVDAWSRRVTELYQHRLAADYDNWRATPDDLQRPVRAAVEAAGAFLQVCVAYLQTRGTSI